MTDTIKIKEEFEWMWNALEGLAWSPATFYELSHERDIPDTITGEDRERLTRFIQERRELADNEVRTSAGHLCELRWHQGQKQFKQVLGADWFDYANDQLVAGYTFDDSFNHERALAWYERNRPKPKRVEFEGNWAAVYGFVGTKATPGKRYRVTIEELDP